MGILKVSGLPGVPTIQVEGEVLRIMQQGGWRIAIAFRKLPGKFQNAIKNLVTERYMPYKLVHRSYKRRQEAELERQKEKEAPAATQDMDKSENPVLVPLPPRGGKVTFAKEADSHPMDSLATTSPKTAPANNAPTNAAPAAVAPVPQPKPQGQILLSIGDELKQALAFLANLPKYRWVHVDNPLKIIKTLNEAKPTFLLSPYLLRRQSMLEYLEKIASMGVLGTVKIVLLTPEKLPPKDIIRCRMLGIQYILSLPLESPSQLQNIIENSNSDPQ
jgi:hypothetical protein